MYLRNRDRTINAVFRKGVLEWGGSLQRLGVKVLKKAPPVIAGKEWRQLNLLKSPMTPASPHPLGSMLLKCSEREALMIQPEGEVRKTVFYFPGCGSERLYADIGMASIYLLVKNNIRVVLPPPNLCCGFPAKVNAKKQMAGRISLRDTIILCQIRDMLGHLVFDAFLISCGTCREALQEMGCADIFACGIGDVSRFVLENTDRNQGGKSPEPVLYHTPCHDSFDGDGPGLLGRFYTSVKSVPNCCSEAGTLAISRPDIAYAMLRRKRESITNAKTGEETTIMATNCPSCLSGLGRNSDLKIVPKHMAVLLAENLGGPAWEKEFAGLIAKAEKVTI
jgi:Fe-S oxidoreductase